MYFWFVDDVIVSHNRASGQNQSSLPDSQTTLRHYVWSSSPGGGTGDEVCCLRLHLVYYLFLLIGIRKCTLAVSEDHQLVTNS